MRLGRQIIDTFWWTNENLHILHSNGNMRYLCKQGNNIFLADLRHDYFEHYFYVVNKFEIISLEDLDEMWEILV